MTTKSARARANPRVGQIAFGVFSAFCLLLILRNTDTAIAYMTRGLLLCARTVIPSLFPFMVLSELIISGGFADRIFSRISLPLRLLLRLPTVGCCAVLLGILCGFPVGVRCATLAYDKGLLSRREHETVCIVASTPSSAFLISAVGASLWGNRAFGIALYGCAVTASLLTGILFVRLRASREETTVTEQPQAHVPFGGAHLFTAAIRAATENILLVCAYVVFFSSLTGTLNLILSRVGLSQAFTVLLTSFFELSSGINGAVGFSRGAFGALLCAATVGWSGLSVHFQLLSLCDGRGFSMKSYFAAKLLQALLCAGLLALLLRFFPSLTSATEACAHSNDWFYLF